MTLADTQSVMAPHNHYVNIGIQGGLLGWGLGVWFITLLWKMHRFRISSAKLRHENVLHYGIWMALLAASVNALFHNAGIFTPELATSCLIGLLAASYVAELPDPIVTRPRFNLLD